MRACCECCRPSISRAGLVSANGGTQPLKVTLSLGSQAFQRDLAATLARRGMLSRALSFGLDLEVLEPDTQDGLRLRRRYPGYRFANRVLWAAWRRLPVTKRSRHFPIVISTACADWLVSRQLTACDIFHGWTGLSLACLSAARRLGAITIIENPSMHPRAWQSIVLEECERFGIRPSDCRAVLPTALIRRMEAEFDQCDFIVVPSAVARDSFSDPKYADKAHVIHAGIDHDFFKPPDARRTEEIFRVCYAGRVELAKGVVYLFEAWKQLALPDAELVMIGEVAREMTSLIRDYAMPNVRFAGYLPADQVRDWYRRSDVFAFPSVNEGLARVLLEAMATGLPVVATAASGAEECVTPGKDGTIVPARDPHAMAEALLWHFENRDAIRAMGTAARLKVEEHFTIAHYEERVIGFYQSLLRS
jgi:glycosyltransferase involved in cell wall biosynthesis